MKTTSEHTPGPWTIHGNIGRKGELGVMADSAPCIIAVMGNQRAWPVEANANARLIAAAPDLLKALEHCCGVIHAIRTGNIPDNLISHVDGERIARAAIAKAAGRSCPE